MQFEALNERFRTEIAQFTAHSGVRNLQDAVERLRAGDRLGYATAAAWLGIPLPRDVGDRIHVVSATGLSQIRARGVVGHRDDGADVRTVRGIPVSSPPRLFLELARVLRPNDLVAAGDHLIHVPRFAEPGRPWTTVEELAAFAARGGDRKGSPAARHAIRFVRPGVESPQETRLRLLLLRAGLPEPICGYELRGPLGRIGWFDLAWPELRVLGEYDGDQHRTDPRQYERDIRRFDRAADEDWRVLRVRAAGLRPDGEADTIRRFSRFLHP